jgi:4-carboxymuconolactone decarboxylase
MLTANQAPDQRKEAVMDDKELYERGLKLRVEMFGREAVDKRMNAFGEFGMPLQHIINAYAYGDVWQRSALPPTVKSLTMVAMMAAAGHQNELRVHLKGAVKNGCTAEQIQEVLLLLTLYCGIPAKRSTPDRHRGIERGEGGVTRYYGGGSVSKLGTGRPRMS